MRLIRNASELSQDKGQGEERGDPMHQMCRKVRGHSPRNNHEFCLKRWVDGGVRRGEERLAPAGEAGSSSLPPPSLQ